MKRVVFKFGTGVISHSQGKALDIHQFRRLSREISMLCQQGMECIIVSSGAIAAGVQILGLTDRPQDLPGKQACAAAGQPILIQQFDLCFRKLGMHTAQLLLTYSDIDSTRRRNNARHTLDRLLAARNIIPIFNENDTVSIEELNLGDNDRLSAEIAILAEAHLLVILTSAPGLMDGTRLIPVVEDIQSAIPYVTNEKGPQSTGGMLTKLEAMRIATSHGIPAIIASGHTPGLLADAVAGLPVGTLFISAKTPDTKNLKCSIRT